MESLLMHRRNQYFDIGNWVSVCIIYRNSYTYTLQKSQNASLHLLQTALLQNVCLVNLPVPRNMILMLYDNTIKEKDGILALNKYQADDFVSMDQFIIITPGQLLTDYG